MNTKIRKLIGGSALLLVVIQSALAKLPGPLGRPGPAGSGEPSRPWDWVDRIRRLGEGPGIEPGLEWLQGGNSIPVAAAGVVFVIFLMLLFWLWQTSKGSRFLKTLVVFVLAMIVLIGFI